MPRPSYSSNPLPAEERLRQAEKLLEQIRPHKGRLSPYERGFVSGIEQNIGYIEITDKRLYWLRDIAGRVGE